MATFEVSIATLCVLGGCHLNVVTLEHTIRNDVGKQMGVLITALQFLAVSAVGFPFLNKSLLRSFLRVRDLNLFYTILLFFITCTINNSVYKYNVSIPVVTVLRMSSVLTTLLMGFMMGKTYTKKQCISVLMVCIGVTLVSLQSFYNSVAIHSNANINSEESDTNNKLKYIGFFLLFISTLLGSLLGLTQEKAYKGLTGLGAMDLMFFCHFFSLPLFFLYGEEVSSAWNILRQEKSLWLYVLLNVLSQLVCIFSVFYLTKSTNALSTNIIVTIRKFLSVLFSVWYFQNPFTALQWLGTFSAFLGVALYSSGK